MNAPLRTSSSGDLHAGVRARYLAVEGTCAVLALLHEPAPERKRGKAVLFCPPFGWEEMCSYRRRREWAQTLANDGYATLRIDLPGAGDSAGSPDDAELVGAWRAATRASVEWLLATTGARTVAGIGIGLGGLLLCDAIGAGARVDELVLWAAPRTGAAFVRELRAFGRLEAASAAADEEIGPEPQPTGGARAGGFTLAPETVSSLESLDASTIRFPARRLRRALMFERDGIPVDEPLREHLAASGVAVTLKPGNGYSEMMAPPHQGSPPLEVIESTRVWLSEDAAPRAGAAVAPIAGSPRLRESFAIELPQEPPAVRESPVWIAQPFGYLFGVLAQPVNVPIAPVTGVLLNAGAHRRVGQGRMWVEAARRWAAAGVPTLRLDLEGIGDSDGDGTRFTDMGELYDERLVTQALAAIDALELRGLGPRYVAAGLCSGACWSFHMALRDPRVATALMINPQWIFWHRSLRTARRFRRASKLKALRGEVELARLMKFARELPAAIVHRALARVRARSGDSELDRALDALRDSGKRLRFLFSGNEPLRAELEAEGWPDCAARWPNVSFDLVPGSDHILRPLVAQRFVHLALDRALEIELGGPLAERTRWDATPGAAARANENSQQRGAPQVVRMIKTEQGA